MVDTFGISFEDSSSDIGELNITEVVERSSGGGGGTTNYEDLENRPSINSVVLEGAKSASDYGLQDRLVAGTGITINEDGKTINAQSDITIDSDMSAHSDNPVQNRTLTYELYKKVNIPLRSISGITQADYGTDGQILQSTGTASTRWVDMPDSIGHANSDRYGTVQAQNISGDPNSHYLRLSFDKNTNLPDSAWVPTISFDTGKISSNYINYANTSQRGIVQLDDTLSMTGQAADAAAVGEALRNVQSGDSKNVWFGNAGGDPGTVNYTPSTVTGDFTLVDGNIVFLKFPQYAHDNVTLNIDGTGALPVYARYTSAGSNTPCYAALWGPDEVVGFVYRDLGPTQKFYLIFDRARPATNNNYGVTMLDRTLTKQNYAADAKAVGDALANINIPASFPTTTPGYYGADAEDELKIPLIRLNSSGMVLSIDTTSYPVSNGYQTIISAGSTTGSLYFNHAMVRNYGGIYYPTVAVACYEITNGSNDAKILTPLSSSDYSYYIEDHLSDDLQNDYGTADGYGTVYVTLTAAKQNDVLITITGQIYDVYA